MSACAARGCEKPIKPGMLMCLPHWKKVPRGLQREVYRTLREFQRSLPPQRRPAWAAYLEAVGSAVESLPSPEQEWLGDQPEVTP